MPAPTPPLLFCSPRPPTDQTSVMAVHAISIDIWIRGSPVQARSTALLYYVSRTADRKAGFKIVILIWFFDVVEYLL